MGDAVTGKYPPMKSRYATGKEYSHAAKFPVETGISPGTLFCRHFCWFINKYMRTGPDVSFRVTSFRENTYDYGWQSRTGALFLLLILYRLLRYTVETVRKAEFFNLSFLGTFSPGLRFLFSSVIGSRYPIDYTILIRTQGKELEGLCSLLVLDGTGALTGAHRNIIHGCTCVSLHFLCLTAVAGPPENELPLLRTSGGIPSQIVLR